MRLAFVYNANAGLMAAFMDSVHKIISPSSYACDLCAITYGLTSMNPQWRDWLRALDIPTHFYHRPDFKADWPRVEEPLPAIFLEQDGTLDTLVSAAEFKDVKQVDQLIALMERKLGTKGIKTGETL